MLVTIRNDDLVADPLAYVGRIAGTCYGSTHGDPAARAVRCWENGHMSVFEHVSVTWDVDGISRACSHQLVRHRLASYTQQSQRYSRIGANPTRDDWYVTPPDLEGDRMFRCIMTECAQSYQDALAHGTRPEDARYMLPEATKTSLVLTMNLRELRHFAELRGAKSAQWEIRELAGMMLAALPNTEPWTLLKELVRES